MFAAPLGNVRRPVTTICKEWSKLGHHMCVLRGRGVQRAVREAKWRPAGVARHRKGPDIARCFSSSFCEGGQRAPLSTLTSNVQKTWGMTGIGLLWAHLAHVRMEILRPPAFSEDFRGILASRRTGEDRHAGKYKAENPHTYTTISVGPARALLLKRCYGSLHVRRKISPYTGRILWPIYYDFWWTPCYI